MKEGKESMESTREKRAKNKRAKSKQVIIAAAKSLFEEKGLRHVTFNDVAKKAEMCRTTIFNYFTSINELMLAIMDEEVRNLMAFCETSRSEGIELVLDVFSKIIDDTARFPVLTTKLIAGSMLDIKRRKVISKIEEIINNAFAEKSVEEIERRVVLITGAYYGIVNHYFLNGKKLDPNKMKREFRNYVAPLLV